MRFAENELRQITEETWQIVLGEALYGSNAPIAPGGIEKCIAACAQIVGDWQLAVVLYCSADAARTAAAIMFATDRSWVANEDIHDAVCELINIIAGNIKGALSGSSRLSLPKLAKGEDFKLMFPSHVLLSECHFVYCGEPLLVVLLGQDTLASRRNTTPCGAGSEKEALH